MHSQSDPSAVPASPPEDTPSRRSRLSLPAGRQQPYLLVLVYVVIFVVFTIASRQFATASNMITIATVTGVLLVVTVGQAITIIGGGFDLSIGGVVPLGAVSFALLSDRLPLWLLFLFVLVIGGAAGAVNAILIHFFRINALIATLGMLSVSGGIALALANGLTISVQSDAGFLGNNGPGDVPYYIYVVLAIVVASGLLLYGTGLGRRVYVVGGNPEAARLAGVRVGRVRFFAYTSSGVLAAFAGIVYASQLLAATGDVGSGTTLSSLAAAVLGGVALTGGEGGVFGIVVGVLILGTVQNGLSVLRIPSYYVTIATGLILVIAMAASSDLRGGFASLWPRRAEVEVNADLPGPNSPSPRTNAEP